MRTLTSKVVVLVLLLTGCGSSVPQPPCEETHYSQPQIEYAVQRAFLALEKKKGTLTGSVWEDTALFAELVEEASHELGCTIPAASSSKMLAAKKKSITTQSSAAICQEVESLEQYDSSVGYCGPDAVQGGEVCTLWFLRNPDDCMNQVCFEHDRCYEEADIPKLSVGGSEVEACLWSDVSTSCDNDFFAGFMECVADGECGWGCSIVKAIAATLQAASDVSGVSAQCVECAQGGDCTLGGGNGNNGTHDTWVATSTNGAPDGRVYHTAVWTGEEMIVWGGHYAFRDCHENTGGKYNPVSDSWIQTNSHDALTGRAKHTAVWTGFEMIVWGGCRCQNTIGDELNSGSRYDPSADYWRGTTKTGAPSGRANHTAVWTGEEMIVWGGWCGTQCNLNTGGRYNPTTDSWTAVSIINAPEPRYDHTAVWTGEEMIVWGGRGISFENTGGRYNPWTDTWIITTTINAPQGRSSHSAIWTGEDMIVWGGSRGGESLNTGVRYNPLTDTWIATTTANAPESRYGHTAVWTKEEMIVWGGCCGGVNSGGRYNPANDSWIATSMVNVPLGRRWHTTVWTGNEMIVWGGRTGYGDPSTGGRYTP